MPGPLTTVLIVVALTIGALAPIIGVFVWAPWGTFPTLLTGVSLGGLAGYRWASEICP